jgi:hypothetical protein
MDVTTRDFSLNFRGFEHEDPETVRRFCAFCEANFDLLPEQAERLATRDETIVLTHSNSSEELEALAKVLREIGARVEVSQDSFPSDFEYTALPNTQDLHRLFSIDTDTGAASSGRNSRIAPIGSSLYLVNPTLASPEHAEILRRRKRSVAETPSTQGERRFLGALSTAALVLIGVALGVIVGRVAFQQRESDPNWKASIQPAPQTMPASTLITHDISKPLSGVVEVSGYRIEVKTLISSTAASIRSFHGDSISPVDGDTPNPRRFEGDPAFLENVRDGVWEGTLTFYTFQTQHGEEVRAQRQARVTITLQREPLSGHAQFTIVPLPPRVSVGDESADPLPLSKLSVPLTQ